MEAYDVIVVGGGPSGSSTAIFLARAGRRVLLLDRQKFPREKICGDGISGRSVGVLRELGLLDQFKAVEHLDMHGVTFSSPDGTVVPIPAADNNGQAPGFVCRREVFDDVLFQNAKKLCARTIEGFMVTELVMEGSRVAGVKGRLDDREQEFRAKVVVGADGAGGFISRKTGAFNDDPGHQCAGVRCYYEGVEGMADRIELHFVKEAIPGYFWIFPLPGKRANVGLCMLVKDMKSRKANLQKAMFDIIENNPVFRPRFAKAKRITDVKSWLLPLGSKKVKRAGDGYVLVGDAASLIDPFTGEGIGNALSSGKHASRTILKAFEQDDFSEKALSEYPKALFSVIGNEVQTNYRMQRLANNTFLLNVMIGKAKRSRYVQAAISDALLDPKEHNRLVDPVFIVRVILA